MAPGNQDSLNRVDKLVDLNTLSGLRRQWRSCGRTVVWTNGCFDLLHLGHVNSLQAAKSLGDILVVGVNSDDSVRTIKGDGRPIYPDNERAEILAALECVDYLLIFSEITPVRVLAELKPDIFCKGSDYQSVKGEKLPEAQVVKAYGGQIEFLPLVPERSTSGLIRRIQQLNG